MFPKKPSFFAEQLLKEVNAKKTKCFSGTTMRSKGLRKKYFWGEISYETCYLPDVFFNSFMANKARRQY